MGSSVGNVGRRIKVGIGLVALCASLIGASGCSFDDGYIKDGNKRLGEWTQASGAILVVLYRSTGGRSYNVNTTDAVLAIYKNYRRTRNMQDSAILTLRFLRGYCGGGYAGDRCRDATGDDEWSDFRNDSLVPVDHTPGACIAVHIRSGENWTTRSRTDGHCIPN